jgi:hypothetical protein
VTARNPELRLGSLYHMMLSAPILALILLRWTPDARPAPPSPEDLLRRSDVGAFAPHSFRAQINLQEQPRGTRHEIEVWRSGEARTLLRFLDPKDRGKYLLRLDDQLWLIAPGAKEPVRMSPSYRLYGGATLDEVLGIRLAKEYVVAAASEEKDAGGPIVVFDLRAKSDRLLFPQVRYVVRSATERPVRATYRLPSGRDATAVDFVEWNDQGLVYARRLVVRDLLRKGAQTEVDVIELEPRAVPDGLFDIRDGSARRTLETGKATPP